MKKRGEKVKMNVWVSLAILGGVLLILGTFYPWFRLEGVFGKSAWDLNDPIALASGLMVLLGAISAWARNALRSMISVGGLLAIVDAGVVYKSATLELDYGFWVFLLGAIIALIAAFGEEIAPSEFSAGNDHVHH